MTTLIQYDNIKFKLSKLFKFLQDFNKIKTPPITDISNYQWHILLNNLPQHQSIDLNINEYQKINSDSDPKQDNNYIVKVRRPNKTSCPEPPDALKNWITPGWRYLNSSVDVIKIKYFNDELGNQSPEYFEDSIDRVHLLQDWINKREEWRKLEIPTRKAYDLFSNFFELWGKIQRESERYQLYLANGFLCSNFDNTNVDHPLLLQKVEIVFNSNIPEFSIVETDDEPEFYSPLLRYINVDPKGVAEFKDIMDNNLYHPLDHDSCKSFMKGLIQRFWNNGRCVDKKSDITDKKTPFIYLEPSLILGVRNQGYEELIENYLESLNNSDEIPESLARIVGFEINKPDNPINKEVDFLLTKETNKEQERIIQSLENNKTVIVQGPPGTGKSHTIANLIGHLLANKKTVLVTSETTKALKVIRGQVVDALQPLCVSLLDNDEESKTQLEESVRGIVGYLSTTDKFKIEEEISNLALNRKRLKDKQSELKKTLIDSINKEYTQIKIGNESELPSTIAKKLFEWKNQHDWIPEPINFEVELPLSEGDLIELYSTNSLISPENEILLLCDIPDSSKIPNNIDFNEFAKKYNEANNTGKDLKINLWGDNNQEIKSLENIIKLCDQLSSDFKNVSEDYQFEILDSGRKGKDHQKIWTDFIEIILELTDNIIKRKQIVLSFDPEINANLDTSNTIIACKNIISHLESGKKLSPIWKFLNPKCNNVIKNTTVNGNTPVELDDFKSILAFLEINKFRDLLKRRWNRQLKPCNGPDVTLLGDQPEEIAFKFIDEFRKLLYWFQDDFKTLSLELNKNNFKMSEFFDLKIDPLVKYSELTEIKKLLEQDLKKIVTSRIHFINHKKFVIQKEEWISYLRSFPSNQNSYSIIKNLINAISFLDTDLYSSSYLKIKELENLKTIFNKRNQLLKILETNSYNWSKFIRNRIAPHNLEKPPSDVHLAWKYARWKQIIKNILKDDIDTAQNELYKIQSELIKVTANYVEKLAWLSQLNRLDLEKQQALNGWLLLHKKMGKGTGKRVPILKAEAKKLLSKCKNAVPVWIMPISRVIESFEVSKTQFDVLIIDEASQSDISAILTFALAKEVIVVGDNEQVSPYAIGQQIEKIQSLIDEHLGDIPNKQLYDGKTSIYDIASHSFGETIRLVEHFRCVPDIIQFSNQLCYNNEIKPLRDSSNTKLLPHLISHNVPDGIRKGYLNIKEAEEIAALVLAMCKIDSYKNKTIGIISLLGHDQASYIDNIIKNKIVPDEYKSRNILCGNAYNFQGDERDIILLSMVDSANEGQLRIKQDDSFKKIINVAASRAKDQLWIVHSLTPEKDLKQGDFRLMLLQHAKNYNKDHKNNTKTSSDFHKLVYNDLEKIGFKVIANWEVGNYTIDMVIMDDKKAIAIECTGDKYTTPENLESDMQNQVILERLGWRFIRIRASEYFQNKDKTINKIIETLNSMGIKPENNLESVSKTPSSENILKQKVLLLAQEIKEDWDKDDIIYDNKNLEFLKDISRETTEIY